MTPQQALQVLEQAASMAPMPKQGHINIEQALAVIKKELIRDKKSEESQEK